MAECPLNGKCLSECTVYSAEVDCASGKKTYFGACEGQFKSRYYNHIKSIKNRTYEKETELSKYIWTMKDQGTDYKIKWDIKAKCLPYQCGSRRCDLCTTEKMTIARENPDCMLNKRSEIVSKCRHSNKFLLKWHKIPKR